MLYQGRWRQKWGTGSGALLLAGCSVLGSLMVPSWVEDADLIVVNQNERPVYAVTVTAEEDGYLNTLNAEEIGRGSMMMGAGRATKEESIDVTAGVELCAAVGEKVYKGQPLFKAYAQDESKLLAGLELLKKNIVVSPTQPEHQPHIYGRVGGLD